MKSGMFRLAAAILSVACFGGADWLQFRGNACNGVADEVNPPKTLENVAWSIELNGRGLASPVIVGDRVFVTSNSGAQQERLHVDCYDEASGKERWSRQFWATGQTSCNNTICMATPSMASDGQRVFAFYSCNDLACFDLEGNLLWYRGLTYDYPNVSNSLGMSSSPVVSGDTLLVQAETDDGSIALALDTSTGVTRWKLDRPRIANWSSPTVMNGVSGAPDRFVLSSGKAVEAIDVATGKVLWSLGGGATIPSVAIGDNAVYVPKSPFTAVSAVQSGPQAKPLWQDAKLTSNTASPAVYNNRIYLTNDAGVLTCADAKKGEIAWRLRLKGPFISSPIIAADYLYIFNEEGLGQVVKLSEKKGEVVSTKALAEKIQGTPAISDGALYARSDKHLWKFVNK